jgi:hypothetical protein
MRKSKREAKKPQKGAKARSGELSTSDVALVVGGAETVHLYLKANGTDVKGE